MNFKNVSLFVNLIVSSLFITKLSLDYFLRQTVTSFESVKNSTTPGISLCFKPPEGVKLDFSLPIKDVISNWSDADLITNVMAGDKLVQFRRTKFLRFRTPCVKLELSTQESVITIKLNEELVKEVYCLVHSRGIFPFGSYSALNLSRNHRRDSEMLMQHVIEARQSVSRHHSKSSTCSRSARKSSAECFENCISNSSSLVLTSNVLSFSGDSRVLTGSNGASLTRNECLKKCSRTPCEEEMFEITMKPAKASSEFKITVKVLVSNVITFIPKMSKEMYLIYITAIIGGTFGFNLFLLIPWIRKSQKWFFRTGHRNLKVLKRRFHSQSALKLIIYALSLAGYIYQVLFITIDYIEHDIIKETYFGPPYTKKAPAISFCIDPIDLLRDDSNLKQCSDTQDEDGRNECRSVLNNMTFSELDKVTNDLWSILLCMTVAPLHSKAVVLNEKNFSKAVFNPVSTFFRDNRKCFKITPIDPFQTKVASYFTTAVTSSIHVYVHDARDYPRANTLREVIVFSDGVLLRYGFLLKTTQLLPAPYSSMCREYPISRTHCLETCIALSAMSMVNRTFPVYIAHADRVDLSLSTIRHLDAETFCSNRCQYPDCNSDEFELILNMDMFDPGYREVSVLTADLQLAVKWLAKISTNDFLICLIATCDLWTGLTLMSAVVTLRKFGPLKSVRYRRYLVTTIGGILLTIGFTFHAINTVNNYLERRTVSRTSVSDARHQVAPCVVFGYIWLMDNPADGFKSQTGDYSTKELDKATKDISEIVKAIEVRNSSTLQWQPASFTEFQMTTMFYCGVKIILACHHDTSTFDVLALRSTGDARVFRARVASSGTSGLALSARQQTSVLKVSLWILYGVMSTSHITYISSLLPFPYSSNCFDYASHGLQSRAICERRCTLDYVYRTKGYISAYVPREGNDTRRPIGNEFEDEYWVSEECVRRCSRPDCKGQFLKGFQIDRTAHIDEEFNVNINIGTTTVETRMFPQQSLLEFVIFFAGLLGMWFGLSLHDAISRGADNLTKLLSNVNWSADREPNNSFVMNAVKSRVTYTSVIVINKH